jgi:hypothetical protein
MVGWRCRVVGQTCHAGQSFYRALICPLRVAETLRALARKRG